MYYFIFKLEIICIQWILIYISFSSVSFQYNFVLAILEVTSCFCLILFYSYLFVYCCVIFLLLLACSIISPTTFMCSHDDYYCRYCCCFSLCRHNSPKLMFMCIYYRRWIIFVFSMYFYWMRLLFFCYFYFMFILNFVVCLLFRCIHSLL